MTTKTKKSVKSNSNFDFKTIKTFEDACAKLGIDPKNLPDTSKIFVDLAKPIIAAYKLMVIFKAINDGWEPDWSKYNQYKYYPWFGVLSSGSGFSISYYVYGRTCTDVGSRLCTDTSEKALYIATQFEKEYQEYLLISE
jgi:hypothetical protein